MKMSRGNLDPDAPPPTKQDFFLISLKFCRYPATEQGFFWKLWNLATGHTHLGNFEILRVSADITRFFFEILKFSDGTNNSWKSWNFTKFKNLKTIITKSSEPNKRQPLQIREEPPEMLGPDSSRLKTQQQNMKNKEKEKETWNKQ